MENRVPCKKNKVCMQIVRYFLCHGLQSKKRGILFLVSLYRLGGCKNCNIGLVGRALIEMYQNNMGLIPRKPVFEVSEKASFKQVSSATETS